MLHSSTYRVSWLQDSRRYSKYSVEYRQAESSDVTVSSRSLIISFYGRDSVRGFAWIEFTIYKL